MERMLDRLRHTVEFRAGFVPRVTSDFDRLALIVSDTTHRTISPSTLKRLWGYVPTTHRPTYSTLSLLSRYAGWSDWDAFVQYSKEDIADDDDSGFVNARTHIAKSLEVGTTVEIQWLPDKSLTLKKISEPDRFEVTASSGVKLYPGDTLRAAAFTIGEPFHATDCRREFASLGIYVGARRSGLLSVTINSHKS